MANTQSDNTTYVYTAYITLKNGHRIYASQYGLKAFRLPVKDKQ